MEFKYYFVNPNHPLMRRKKRMELQKKLVKLEVGEKRWLSLKGEHKNKVRARIWNIAKELGRGFKTKFYNRKETGNLLLIRRVR